MSAQREPVTEAVTASPTCNKSTQGSLFQTKQIIAQHVVCLMSITGHGPPTHSRVLRKVVAGPQNWNMLPTLLC